MISSAMAPMLMMPCHARLATQRVWPEEFWAISGENASARVIAEIECASDSRPEPAAIREGSHSALQQSARAFGID